jgi:hypothetical protein
LATNPPAAPPAKDPRDDAFIREVDDAYREEELKKFWSRYGRWVLLGVGIALAAVGGTLFWQAEQGKRRAATSEQFSAALDKVETGALPEARTALAAIAEDAEPTYRALALLTSAGVSIGAGEASRAAGLFRSVADDARVAAPLRDAARMKLLRLEFDGLPPAEVVKRAQPFLEGDNPWFPIAAEMAALAHLKSGNPNEAGPLFLRIAADERAPVSLRARSEQMAAALGQDVSRVAQSGRPGTGPAAAGAAPEAGAASPEPAGGAAPPVGAGN